MGKHKIIILMLILTASVFTQSGRNFYHLYSTQNRNVQNYGHFPPYSYKFAGGGKRFPYDSVEIYAIKIEFEPDSSSNRPTTGNGLFMRESLNLHRTASNGFISSKDEKDFALYDKRNPYVYRYDRLPHDSTYFHYHLSSLRNYYRKVSNNSIEIKWKIFPGDSAFAALRLDEKKAYFSPGQKPGHITNDEFGTNKARSMMRFVAKSVKAADATGKLFNTLQQNKNGMIYKINEDTLDTIPVFMLLIHAGASALTDGGEGGAGNADSPNDFTDAFIGEELFKFFSNPHEKNRGDNPFKLAGVVVENDPITNRTGIQISGKDEKKITLSELMMVSETANQDSLNGGINGILVNQFARQIGIPDLYSTSSGTSGIGRFGIMDFAGYFAANGFIPPNPSAFIRAFMGWETPIHAKAGENYEVNIAGKNLFLVPINSTEYYLIENRQRNPEGLNLFVYDEINGKHYIATDFRVNLNENIGNTTTLFAPNKQAVVNSDSVKSRDIGLPASGICVWHIDEKLVDNRLKHNMLNSDSAYRAVNLMEADGIIDIGIQFSNILGYSMWDYGSAADVFPHTSVFKTGTEITNKISPTTSPATVANDGGNTFLKLEFTNKNPNGKKEIYHYEKGQDQNSKFNEYEVINISDSVIKMSISLQTDSIKPVANFPVKIKNDSSSSGFFPLMTANFSNNGTVKVIVALSKNGWLSIIDANGKNTLLLDSIAAVNMPTLVGNDLFVPCKNKIMIYKYNPEKFEKDSIENINISSNIIGMSGKTWVAGTKNGEIIFDNKIIKVDDTEINAIAKIDENLIVAVTKSGKSAIVSKSGSVEKSEIPNAKFAFPPFKVAVFDKKIAISDSKNGLWILGETTNSFPIDWTGIFRENSERKYIPDNSGYISAADLTGDGTLNILLGGTNGVYAFDDKGNLLANYPALLDRADWFIRKSVQATPIAAKTSDGEAMIFFTTTTGDTKSFYQTPIIRYDYNRGTVWFNNINGNLDSLSGYSAAEIDTMMIFNDGIIMPYFAPGGLIEIRNGKTGKRPDNVVSTSNAGKQRIFPYLISMGTPASQGVVLDSINDTLNLIAISDDGMLYRFALPNDRFPANQTNMVGGNAQRQFNFVATGNRKAASQTLEYFYSYPNPVRVSKNGRASVNFRYELGDNANSAHLTIYTVQGQKVFEERNLPLSRGVNEYTLNDFSRFGSAVYRCRLSVKFGGNEKVLFWKMAVLR